jgi:hypothetical protein
VIRNPYSAFTIDSSTPTLRINLNEGTIYSNTEHEIHIILSLNLNLSKNVEWRQWPHRAETESVPQKQNEPVLVFFEKLKGKENTSTIPNFILLVRINRRRLLLSRSTFAAIYSKQFPRQSKKRAKNHNYPLPVGAFLRSIIVRIVRKPSNN